MMNPINMCFLDCLYVASRFLLVFLFIDSVVLCLYNDKKNGMPVNFNTMFRHSEAFCVEAALVNLVVAVCFNL